MSAPTSDLPSGTPAPRPADPSVRFQFGPFRLDPAERLLLREGRPVALTPKAFDLLLYLVQRPGRLADKHALMTALWPDAVVEETNLTYTISAVRKALGDGNDGEQLIQTVPTRGYRFVAPVRELALEPPARPSGAGIGKVALVAGGLAAVLVGAFFVGRWNKAAPTTHPIVRFELPVAVGLQEISIPAISPDGTRIVYSGPAGAEPQLFMRTLDGLQVTPLAGTVGGRQPFFSPDGRAIGFVGSGGLMTLDLASGRLARVSSSGRFSTGGAWGSDGRIYGGRVAPRGISVVSADGGEPAALTKLADKEIAHGWPELLPGGRHLLFSVWEGDDADDARIEILSLDTAERRTVLRGGFCARYLPTEHLVYARGGALYGVAFDPRSLQVRGTPVRVLEGLGVRSNGAALFCVSPNGTLVYHPGGVLSDRSEIAWFDPAQGTERAVSAPPGAYVDPSLSPDDKRVALAPSFGARYQDIWVHEFARGTWTRVTTSPRFEAAPVWHPLDPTRLVFTAVRQGPEPAHDALMSAPADGSAAAERLYESAFPKYATSSAPAAGLLAFVEFRPGTTKWDLWLLDLRDKPVARPFLQTQFSESCPSLSPDGRWLAYESDESGRAEIYVRAVSGPERKWQVSPEGGDRPRWSRNGRRIVYRSGKRMMVVDVAAGASFTAGQPQVLAAVPFEPGGLATPNYDITADGRRLLLITPVKDPPRLPLIVVENWFAELREKLHP
jgi:DNA-binding winged helix-turn-helix (wHTH) protein/Tol biopolymer transport system component